MKKSRFTSERIIGFLKQVDFARSSGVRNVPIYAKTTRAGDVTSEFKPAEPFKRIK